MSAWSEAARTLYAFWDAKRAGRAMPARRDIDPVEMKPWLARLMLIEVVEGGRDFRYRLVGSDVAQRLGFEATGKLQSELPAAPEILAQFQAEHRAVVESGRPGFAVHAYVSPVSDRWIKFERLLLPLGEAGGGVTMLLGMRNDLIDRRTGDRD